jgi:hypothetical protein
VGELPSWEATRPATKQQQETTMVEPKFDVSFTKYVNIMDKVDIDKSIDVNVHVKGNSAIANSTADAYGYNTHSETLTQTWSSQGDATHVGYSGSVSESVSASTGALFHW